MKKVIVIDNYDSFTYNLVHEIRHIIGGPVTVRRNDEVNYEEVDAHDYIILSPGPGVPDEAGQLKDVIRRYYSSKKMLGVCLGLQAIGEVFGGKLRNLDTVYHGIQTSFTPQGDCLLFEGMDDPFLAGRYHSWVIDKTTLPEELILTCTGEHGEIMGVKHREYPLYGVQFHPESILTPQGDMMLRNFLNIE